MEESKEGRMEGWKDGRMKRDDDDDDEDDDEEDDGERKGKGR